tara:strand:+ start:1146 stop:1547 length:402 start_codon:yes stop_codon:yes gene_type:complete
MTEQAFSVPIMLEVGGQTKKKYYLNLNGYRNWHFQLNNQLKKMFKIVVAEDIRKLSRVDNVCKVTYTIYYPTKRAFDIDNIGSVITKFTHDALVEFEILEDDNYNFVNEISYKFGGVDKDNPRCDVVIIEQDD